MAVAHERNGYQGNKEVMFPFHENFGPAFNREETEKIRQRIAEASARSPEVEAIPLIPGVIALNALSALTGEAAAA